MSAIFKFIIGVIFLPIYLVLALFRVIMSGKIPIEDVISKSSFFLKPQISVIEERFDNKFAVTGVESIAYALAVGEAIGGRGLLYEEQMPYLIGVFGEDYRSRFNHLYKALESNYEAGELDRLKREIQGQAKADVHSGIVNSSNYLLKIAESMNQKIQTMQSRYQEKY